MIEMRPARPDDADLLFAWRNDPLTRALSHNTAPIAREDHDRWMQFNVHHGYPTHLVMMADSDQLGSVGVVRFDCEKDDVMSYTVSVTIAPNFRGAGLGGQALAEACRLMSEYTLLAEIRPENAASIRIFERCGFKRVRKNPSKTCLRFRRMPQ